MPIDVLGGRTSDASTGESAGIPAAPVFTTDRYTSLEFAQRERERIFGRCWLIVARESDILNPGDRLPIDELGEALLLVRGDDGVVRAFRNTCRHRGTRLVAKKCSAGNIRCPYHGWIFSLDGRLRSVPKKKGFAALNTEDYGLYSLRTATWGGFAWVTFDNDAPPLDEYLGALKDDLAPYQLTDMRPLRRKVFTLPCNWKALIDQATESYHLNPVHSRSIGRMIETRAEFTGLYPHHRQRVPIADYSWRHALDRWTMPAHLTFTADQKRLFHKYVIFPNTVINVLPYQLTVFRVFPVDADNCRFHYEFYVRKDAGVAARLRGWLTLLASLYILREDFSVLMPFQSGQHAAHSRAIPFHAEEDALEYFHGVVDHYLEVGSGN